jgi:hypothetical protein
MDLAVEGISIKDIAPDAIKYFEAANATMTMGVAELVTKVSAFYEKRLEGATANYKSVALTNSNLRDQVRVLTENLELARAKLSHKTRPKAKSVSVVATGKKVVAADATTEALLAAAAQEKPRKRGTSGKPTIAGRPDVAHGR